jgi:hypothetical protein
MLGRLSRWLRLSGYDVLYDKEFEDAEIMQRGKDRVILTRDKKLFTKARKAGLEVKLLFNDDLVGQLKQLKREVGIELQDTPRFSRCPVCNSNVEKVEKSEVKDEVPEKVFEHVAEFWHCRGCKKIYWHGGHWGNIEKTVKEIEGK